MPHADFPGWLHALAIFSIAVGLLCALWVAWDVTRHPQKMWIMNLVWPLTALFGGLIWLALYLTYGRSRGRGIEEQQTPFPAMVAKGASHCGAGCALGDLIAEWLAFAFPAIAVALGWHSLFEEKMFAVWIFDYLIAFALGVLFQYFTIKPMRDLSMGQGLLQAVKADAASITSWQVGMYGFMAIAQLLWFQPAYGGSAQVNTPEFWFAMQIAMLCGFATAYPVNWWLIRAGVKEKM